MWTDASGMLSAHVHAFIECSVLPAHPFTPQVRWQFPSLDTLLVVGDADGQTLTPQALVRACRIYQSCDAAGFAGCRGACKPAIAGGRHCSSGHRMRGSESLRLGSESACSACRCSCCRCCFPCRSSHARTVRLASHLMCRSC